MILRNYAAKSFLCNWNISIQSSDTSQVIICKGIKKYRVGDKNDCCNTIKTL